MTEGRIEFTSVPPPHFEKKKRLAYRYSLSAELMYDESTAQLRFKPCSLRRHDIARVGYVHDLLHCDRIESEGSLHLSAVYSALEFAEPSESSDEVYALVASEVLDAEDVIEDEL